MKKRKARKQGTRGAVSVFLAIILVPCIIISSIFVDVGRVQLSKTVAESSADLAMNALLTNYDADLKEWYGMIASCQTIEEFYEASANFFLRTLKSQGLSDDEIVLISDYYSHVTGDDTIYDLLAVEALTGAADMIQEVSGANLSNAKLIKDQVIEFMKYRAPIEIATNLFTRIAKDPTVNDAIEADANKPLVESKQAFYESEGKLIGAAFESFKAINNFFKQSNGKLTNEHIAATYTMLEEYKANYQTMLSVYTTYLVNVSDLANTTYTRPYIALNNYNAKYSDTDYYFDEVYSEMIEEGEGDDKEEVYYIDLGKIQSHVNGLSNSITQFENAIANFESAASSVEGYLPIHMTNPDNSNTLQWYAKAYNAVISHRQTVYNALDAMLRAYSKVLAIYECEPRGLPQNYVWDSDYKVNNMNAASLLSRVQTLHNTYISRSQNSGNTYLNVSSNLESACGELYKAKITWHTVTVDGTSYILSGAVTQMSKNLTERRAFYQNLVNLLNIAINGDGDEIPKLSTLKNYATDYHNKLTTWDSTAQGTIGLDGNQTQMAQDDKADIDNHDVVIDIKAADVDALEKRLINIRSQLEDAIKAIDSLTWGGTPIKDINSWDKFKGAAGNCSGMGLTNGQIKTYTDSLFKQKFAPETMPTAKHLDENAYNPKITPNVSPYTGEVDTPELWTLMYQKFQAKEEQIQEAKDDMGKAEDQGTAKADAAKNKGRYSYGGAEIPHVFAAGNNYNAASAFTKMLELIKKITQGESALMSLRDDLYLTTYIMEMFSHGTFEREGLYNLLDTATQKKLTMDKAEEDYYATVKTADSGKWLSTDPVDHFNKTLTNKHITKEHNPAYCAEIEYILLGGGGGKNAENVKKVFNHIYTIRYGLNLVSGFANFWQQKNTTSVALNGAANAVSLATSGIIPAPLIKAVLIPILTIFETATDLDRLEIGFPVELYKTEAEMWWFSLEVDKDKGTAPQPKTISEFMGAFTKITPGTKTNDGQGIFYSDYLTLFVYLGLNGATRDAMLQRMAEVIQFNIGTMANDKTYSLQKSRMYFTLKSQMRVKPLMVDLPVFTNYGYTELTDNLDWCTYDIDIVRGYS